MSLLLIRSLAFLQFYYATVKNNVHLYAMPINGYNKGDSFITILKVNTVSWSADGSHLLSGSDDCHLNIYDALKRKVHKL